MLQVVQAQVALILKSVLPLKLAQSAFLNIFTEAASVASMVAMPLKPL